MSVPHTGKLWATINGLDCFFNGDTWVTPDSDLTEQLNVALRYFPKHHASINELAEHSIRHAGLQNSATIDFFEGDSWPTELPPGAID